MKIYRLAASISVAAFLFALPAGAQTPGAVDASFDTGSTVDSVVRTVAEAGNGKVYLGGDFTSLPGAVRSHVARLNADGTVDATFTQTGTGLSGAVNALAVQADGKVLVGGFFYGYNGTPRLNVARLNANGTLDTTFAQTGSGLSSAVQAIALQPDGKVIVGGSFTGYNGTSRPRIARLNSDGTLDTTFAQTGTGIDGTVYSLAMQADGKVLVGGYFTTYNGTSRPYLARLNADGTLDTTFAQTGTGLNGTVYSLAVQADGKVLAGGDFYTYNNTSRPYLARLNAAGTLDTTFAQTGMGLNGTVYSLAVQADGKVLVGGGFNAYNSTSRPCIARLKADGTLDTTFAQTGTGLSTGTGLYHWVWSLALQVDGKVIVGGNFTTYNGTSRPRIARLNSSGTADTTFGTTGTGLDNEISSLALQLDGKLLVSGMFTSYSNTSRPYLARLGSDGKLDTTFGMTGTGLNSSINSLTLQADSKILVAGYFTSYNGTPRNSIVRLNSDGKLDTTFTQTGTGLNYIAEVLAVQSDGKVLVAGGFTSYNGTSTPYLARLHSNGTLDSTFAQTGSGLNDAVYSLAVQVDGKILVGGNFTTYNGISRPRIARLNSDGTLDTTFAQTGTGLNRAVFSLAVQPDGKVLLGGSFSTYNSTARPCVARLNADGTLDTTFAQTGTGLNHWVRSIALQADGKVLLAGYFTAYNGISRNGIVRTNSNGTLDTSFVPGSGANNLTAGVALQPDGRVLLGGSFGVYNSTPRSFLVRTHNGAATGSLSAASASRVQWLRGGSTPEVDRVTFERSPDGMAWSFLGAGTRISGGWELAGLSLPRTGQIRARAVGGNPGSNSSLVEQVVAYAIPTVAEAWAQSHGVPTDLSLLGANGQANVLNFGFGMDPNAGAGGALVYAGTFSGPVLTAPILPGLPVVRNETSPGSGETRALFVRRKDHVEAGLTYGVRFSPDLTTWQPSVTTPTVLADDGSHQIVSVPFPALINGQEARFFTVSVSLTP